MAKSKTQSLADWAAGLRDGETSSRALAEAAIARHDATGGSFGAYKSWDPAMTLAQADAADAALKAGIDLGPLHGLPVSVKDLYGVQGYPTFAGTPKELPPEWRTEGPLVRTLRHQMGVITGKTHTVEFAFGGIGHNPHWGTPRNPWDAKDHRIPGGSSSGAGVSLIAGSAMLAFGSDTAGSVRIPASLTGNVGLKTSYGRWSLDGIVPLSTSLDTAGILTRTAEDSAYAFCALDPMARDSGLEPDMLQDMEVAGLTIGVSDGLLWQDLSPGVGEGVEAALGELKKAGAEQVALPLPEVDAIDPLFRKGGLAAVELYAFLKSNLPEWLGLIDEIVQQRMAEASTLPAVEYLDRVRAFEQAGASAAVRLDEVDVLVSPTVALTPPTVEEISVVETYRGSNLLTLRNTAVVNYLGLCALTMPVALDKTGMPVGLQLIANHGEEENLLATALAFERVLGTGEQRLGVAPMAAS